MKRREFITRSLTTAFAGAGLLGSARVASAASAPKFKLRYAPHPNMFKQSAGEGLIDQIKFASDQGFTAWEDNGLPNRTPEMQTRIGQALSDRGMKMGVFVAYASFDQPTFAVAKEEWRTGILNQIRDSVEVAKRVGAKWMTVVPGSVDQQSNQVERWNKYGGSRLAPGYQTANAIELLRRCAEILEPHGLVMVLEPLNWYANHGGVLLARSDQAYALCKAVDSPSCKILFDIYHQQITEGNLIPNISKCWDEIGYFQSGDNPGRNEPGTGEINYRNVFKFIHDRSRADNRECVIGMEHGNSKRGAAGERAVIEAYREADSYSV